MDAMPDGRVMNVCLDLEPCKRKVTWHSVGDHLGEAHCRSRMKMTWLVQKENKEGEMSKWSGMETRALVSFSPVGDAGEGKQIKVKVSLPIRVRWHVREGGGGSGPRAQRIQGCLLCCAVCRSKLSLAKLSLAPGWGPWPPPPATPATRVVLPRPRR